MPRPASHRQKIEEAIEPSPFHFESSHNRLVQPLRTVQYHGTRLVHGAAFDKHITSVSRRRGYASNSPTIGCVKLGAKATQGGVFFARPYTSSPIMSQNPPGAASSSDYEVIFDNVLKAYKTKTGKDLAKDPLLRRLETCNSPDSVLSLLRQQIPGFDQSESSDERLTNWVSPTVNVLCTFATTIGGVVSLVSHGKINVIRL